MILLVKSDPFLIVKRNYENIWGRLDTDFDFNYLFEGTIFFVQHVVVHITGF